MWPMHQDKGSHRAHGLHGGDQTRFCLAELPQLAGPGVAAAAGKVAQHAACGQQGERVVRNMIQLGVRVGY